MQGETNLHPPPFTHQNLRHQSLSHFGTYVSVEGALPSLVNHWKDPRRSDYISRGLISSGRERDHAPLLVAKAQRARARHLAPTDIDQIRVRRQYDDKKARASAAREVWPCCLACGIFRRLRHDAKQLQHEPDPLVRANTQHPDVQRGAPLSAPRGLSLARTGGGLRGGALPPLMFPLHPAPRNTKLPNGLSGAQLSWEVLNSNWCL